MLKIDFNDVKWANLCEWITAKELDDMRIYEDTSIGNNEKIDVISDVVFHLTNGKVRLYCECDEDSVVVSLSPKYNDYYLQICKPNDLDDEDLKDCAYLKHVHCLLCN